MSRWLVARGLVAGGWWLVAVVPNTRTHTQTHRHIDYRHKITNDDKGSSKVNQSSHMKIQTHDKIEFSIFF